MLTFREPAKDVNQYHWLVENCSIFPLILLMRLMFSVSSCMHHFGLPAVERILRHFKTHPRKGLIFTKHSHLRVKVSQMQIGLDCLMIDILLMATILLLVVIL